MRFPLALLLVFLALAASSQASVIVVAASGGGAFTDLPPAIAAANDGDVVLVKSGTYSGFVIANEALDVVADVGAQVVVQGQIAIANVAATRVVTLTGLTLRGPPGSGSSTTPALRLFACSGSVRIQGCDIAGASGAACLADQWGATGVEIAQCQDVALARCTLRGGDGGDFGAIPYGGYGGSGVGASNSRIALHECTVRGGRGGGASAACGSLSGYAGPGDHGAQLTSCASVFASRCAFVGGAGGDSPFLPQCQGSGVLAGGVGALTFLETSALQGTPGAPGNCVRPDVDITPPQTFTTLPGSGRTLTTNRVVREPAHARLALAGTPGDVVEVVFADAGRFVTSSAWRGVELVARSKPGAILRAGVVPGSGELDVDWPIGELGPGVQARRILVQARFTDASGVTTLSTPATVVLLDAAF